MTTDGRHGLLERSIAEDPRLTGSHITVTSLNGAVTLSGSVPSLAAKVQAERTAWQAGGVYSVSNELTVSPRAEEQRGDREIGKIVRHVLEWNSQAPDEAIEVSVEDGVVRLEGEVERQHQKEAAATAILQLGGVRGLINDVVVRPRVTESHVEESIRNALLRNAEVDAERIQVKVAGTTVTLRGLVRSSAELQAIESAAWAASGVTKVESHVRSEEELASV